MSTIKELKLKAGGTTAFSSEFPAVLEHTRQDTIIYPDEFLSVSSSSMSRNAVASVAKLHMTSCYDLCRSAVCQT